MTAIILHRTDPMKNMRRFYRLDVQPDLFGHRAVARVPCPEKLARTVEAGEKRSVADVHDHEALAELPLEGLAGLEDKARRGPARKYGAEAGRRILALLDQPPPEGYARWTGA